MIRYVEALVAAVFVVALSACGGSVTSSMSIVGKWTGTQADGKAIALDISQDTPGVSAILSVDGEADRALTGTYADGALDINANDSGGAINFNATVAGNSMTGSYVTFQAGDPIGTGGSFTMTK